MTSPQLKLALSARFSNPARQPDARRSRCVFPLAKRSTQCFSGDKMSAKSQDFDAWNKQQWHQALNKCFPAAIPTSACWTNVDAMVATLAPFCALNVNHTHLPSAGGTDIIKLPRCRVPNSSQLPA